MVKSFGLRVMHSEFSPIAGTPDGEYCRGWVDIEQPLWHNKATFTIDVLGDTEAYRRKNLAD